MTSSADDINVFCFLFFFHRKQVDISYESCVKQKSHMKCQDLISRNNINNNKTTRISCALLFYFSIENKS